MKRKRGAVWVWERRCPLCEKVQINVYPEGERYRVANDLRTHIRSVKDDRHGGVNDYPEGVVPDELDEHVTRIKLMRDETRSRSGGRTRNRAKRR